MLVGTCDDNALVASGMGLTMGGMLCELIPIIPLRDLPWPLVSLVSEEPLVSEKQPRNAKEIVTEASSKIGEIGYNMLWKNCEHFTSYCRYGVNWSKQADNAMLALGAVVVGGIVEEYFRKKKD
uniref:LRAT domain-containing protein n=1 Tax=Magallana gigas TaxID=29159 RepID=A0A8W8L629_MAGGI